MRKILCLCVSCCLLYWGCHDNVGIDSENLDTKTDIIAPNATYPLNMIIYEIFEDVNVSDWGGTYGAVVPRLGELGYVIPTLGKLITIYYDEMLLGKRTPIKLKIDDEIFKKIEYDASTNTLMFKNVIDFNDKNLQEAFICIMQKCVCYTSVDMQHGKKNIEFEFGLIKDLLKAADNPNFSIASSEFFYAGVDNTYIDFVKYALEVNPSFTTITHISEKINEYASQWWGEPEAIFTPYFTYKFVWEVWFYRNSPFKGFLWY